MRLFWYLTAPSGRAWAELIVDEPGHGRLTLRRLDDHHETHPESDLGNFAGRELAEVLQPVTDLALSINTRSMMRVSSSQGESVTLERRDAALCSCESR